MQRLHLLLAALLLQLHVVADNVFLQRLELQQFIADAKLPDGLCQAMRDSAAENLRSVRAAADNDKSFIGVEAVQPLLESLLAEVNDDALCQVRTLQGALAGCCHAPLHFKLIVCRCADRALAAIAHRRVWQVRLASLSVVRGGCHYDAPIPSSNFLYTASEALPFSSANNDGAGERHQRHR